MVTVLRNDEGQFLDTDIATDQKLKEIYKVVLDIRQRLVNSTFGGVVLLNKSDTSQQSLEDSVS